MLCNNSHTKALGSLAWTRRLVVSHDRKALEEDGICIGEGAATFFGSPRWASGGEKPLILIYPALLILIGQSGRMCSSQSGSMTLKPVFSWWTICPSHFKRTRLAAHHPAWLAASVSWNSCQSQWRVKKSLQCNVYGLLLMLKLHLSKWMIDKTSASTLIALAATIVCNS